MNFRSNITRTVKGLLQPGEGLYQRTVRSGVWAFALRISDRGFGIVRLIVLARVLAPNDFGLMGIAMLAMMALENFSQTGFQQALIQKKGNISDYLDSAWTFMLLRNVALCVILFFAAPYIAIFFDAPEASAIVQVIGFSLLLGGVGAGGGLGGLVNPGIIYFRKELQFKKQFIFQISGTLADFGVAVSAALILQSVWALVFGLLAGNFVRLIASYLIHPYRPRFKLDLAKAKELFGFGKWILGSTILVFLIAQGDDILVGKILGATMLGFYQMAYRLSNAPATEVSHVISQVTFPAYSKLQDNLRSLRESYLKTLQLTAFISIPLAVGIFIIAPEFTNIFLGEKWMPMVPAMQALALAGLIRSIAATMGPVFRAVGKPEIDTKWQIVRFLILAICIYPLSVRWDILGTSIAVGLSISLSTLGFSYMVIKVTTCEIKEFSKVVSPPLVNGFMMASSMLLTLKAFNSGDMGKFLATICVGVLVYLSGAYLFDKVTNYGMWPLVKKTMASSLGK